MHRHLRFGFGRQLVRARRAAARRHDGLGIGRPGQHGLRRALRAGGQVGASGPAGRGAGGRWRHADAGYQ
ncbi:hypothetical protein G6F68_021690 [Rhizopus microsporus]|nr:hypothetical protein G6F68_021690 [Rhizopus microsporus]KAG1361751.1 hypothetical protein G6F59_019022 [Rhizopus arrhizus]